jgi:hypothetical protein
MVGVGRTAVVRLAVLPALAALWLCAPTAARAGCGDYVAFGPHAAAEHARPADAPVQPAAPAPRPCPCRGPQCSGGCPTPLPPVTTAPVTPEHWACLADAPDAAGRDRHACRPAPEPRTSCGCVRSIFHPPRLS